MPQRNVTVAFAGPEAFDTALCDLTIDTTTTPGRAQLAPSVLIHDEIGDGNLATELSETVHARKQFLLAPIAAKSARLLVFLLIPLIIFSLQLFGALLWGLFP